MEIIKEKDNGKLSITLEGRLDTTTAPSLESELSSEFDSITDLTFDFEKLEYISSAGLRVLLTSQKIMSKKGSMAIKNVNQEIMDVFDMTGFSDILTIL